MPIIMTGPDIVEATLPVKWTAAGLQATVENGAVKLNWGTESELNTQSFVVERSVNGTNFSKVGTVASKANGGVSTSVLHYNFTDGAPLAKAVYRVGEVTNDGKVTYSNTVSVALNGEQAALSVYPNPAAGSKLHVKGTAAGSAYRIVSLAGISVARGVVNESKQINVNGLASGIYSLQVVSAHGAVKSVMFVKK